MKGNSKEHVIRPAWRGYAIQIVMGLGAAGAAWKSSGLERWLIEQQNPFTDYVLTLIVAMPWIGEFGVNRMVGGVMALIAMTLLGSVLVNRYSAAWRLGPERIHESLGIIATQERSMQYRNARVPTVRRSFIERLLVLGTVELSSAGTGQAGEIRMEGVSDPMRIKDELVRRIQTP